MKKPNLKKLQSQADAGYAEAQYKVAEIYEKGKQVPRDISEAHKWYTIAKANGYDVDKFTINALEMFMTDEEKEHSKKLAQDWISSHKK